MLAASCTSTGPAAESLDADLIPEGDIVPHGYVLPTTRCELGSEDGEGCSCDELWPDGPRFCATSDADCPTGHCDTIGLVRECVEGTCRTDADCTMRPGGGQCETRLASAPASVAPSTLESLERCAGRNAPS